jgi:hypothetical protein
MKSQSDKKLKMQTISNPELYDVAHKVSQTLKNIVEHI